VRQLVAQLSPEDLALLDAASADTSPDATDPELSDEGEVLGEQVVECLVDGEADPALVTAAKERLLSEGSNGIDTECLETNLAKLDDAQLQALIDAEPDTTDPKVLSAASLVLGCYSFDTGDSAPASGSDVGAVDVCGSIDVAKLQPLATGIGEGDPGSTLGPFGDGSSCKFLADKGYEVTVTVTPNADLTAWEAESANADGLSDGGPVEGVGDAAFLGHGSITTAVGTSVVQVKVFPSFDATPEILTAVALALLSDLQV